MVRVVARKPLLQEGVDDEYGKNQAHEQPDPDRGGNGVMEEVELPRRPEPGQAVGPHHVEVGLAARRYLGGFVRAELPDRVDLQQAAHQAQHADDGREKRAGLDREDRHHAHADDVVLGAARAGELGVLLEPDEREVHPDQCQDDPRQQQDMQGVQARDDDLAGEVATKQRPMQPGAHHRHTQRD